MSSDATTVRRAREVLADAGRVVVLTGAGISTDSGIPDFRGPKGVWTRDPSAERLATLDVYMSDPDARVRAWASRVDNPAWAAEPNAGHDALVRLERTGRLDLLVTQNIDGLHQIAGSDPARTVEIHGTIRDVVCMTCGDRHPSQRTLDRVRLGEGDPQCLICGGILKSATISFGQQLVADDLERAFAAARSCDVLMAVGSTLSVFPVANMVPLAASVGSAIVIVNGADTEMDDLADVVLRGSISHALQEIIPPDRP